MKVEANIIRLGDIADVQSGGTPLISNKSFWGGDIPWYSSGELNDVYTTAPERYISKAGLDGSNAKVFPEGSLLIGIYDTAALKMSIIDRPAAFNQAVVAIRPNDKIDMHFICHAINSMRDHILGQRRGVRQKNLSLEKIRSIELPLPPLQEQQRIVAILNNAFNGVSKAQLNAEESVRKGNELLESYLETIVTLRGKEWVSATIGQHIRFVDYRGKTPVKTDSGLRLITAKNVKMGFLQQTPMEFVAPESYDGWMTRGIPKRGDVLFTTEAPLANVAQLDTDEKVVFAQRVIIMQPDSTKLDSTFLKYLLLSRPIQQRIQEKGTGATVKGIKASLLKGIEIAFPNSLAEQRRLAAKMDALTEEIGHLRLIFERKTQALNELKLSLLHQAFTGGL